MPLQLSPAIPGLPLANCKCQVGRITRNKLSRMDNRTAPEGLHDDSGNQAYYHAQKITVKESEPP